MTREDPIMSAKDASMSAKDATKSAKDGKWVMDELSEQTASHAQFEVRVNP